MPAETASSRPWYDRPLRLGVVAGVPVAVSTSWLLITVVMVALFAPRIHGWLPYVGAFGSILVALGYTLLLALSVLAHELGHAFTAKAFNWTGSTIEITLWGGHTTFREVNSTPARSLLVSVAGPLTNLVLGGAALAWILVAHPGGVPGALLSMAAWGNLLLGAFNLLPGLPLDGGRFVESLGWRLSGSRATGTVAAGWAGRIVAILGAAALVANVVRTPTVTPFIEVAIAITVLLPLWGGASSAIAHGRLHQRIERLDVPSLAAPVAVLAPEATVADAVAAGVSSGTVVIGAAVAPDGTRSLLRIHPDAVATVADEFRGRTPAVMAGVAADDMARVPLSAPGEALVDAVIGSTSGTALVLDQTGRIVGAVGQDQLIGALEAATTETKSRKRTN
jgi:Zn-dependent protease